MNHALLIPRRRSGFSPLNFGSDLALWLDPSYGVYTDRSTQLVAASSQYWEKTSAAGLASSGSFSVWIYADSTPAYNARIVEIGDASDHVRLHRASDGTVHLFGFSGGSTTVFDISSAALSNSTWYHVVGTWDSAGATLYINGSSVATSAGDKRVTLPGSTTIRVGQAIAGGTLYWDGRIDSLAIYSAAIASGVVTTLYDSASGIVYADLASTTSLVDWYDFDGDGLDAHGSNDLTGTNSPTYTSGIASGVAGDGDVVSLVDARTGPNCGPPSYAGRPLWVANAGKPYFSFDGTNDGLQTASNISLGAFTIAGNFYASGTAGMLFEHSAVASNDGNYTYGTTGNTIHAARGGTASGKNLSVDWAVDSTWRTIVQQCDGTHAGHLLRLNGVNQSLTNSGTTGNPGTGTETDLFNIACRNQASEFSTMRLGDLVAVNRVLTAGELSQLESWLASRRSA